MNCQQYNKGKPDCTHFVSEHILNYIRW